MVEEIEWSGLYSVGKDSLDEQHKWILKILNCLINSGKKNDTKFIDGLLTNLLSYANDHFTVEEKYMDQLAYPDIEQHKKLHKTFIMKIAELTSKATLESYSVEKEIVQFLREWFECHILMEDMKYKIFCDENNQKVSS